MVRCKACYKLSRVVKIDGMWVSNCSLKCQEKELTELRKLEEERKTVEEKNN